MVAQPQAFADLLPAEQRELAADLAARGRGFFVGVRPEHLSLASRMSRTPFPPWWSSSSRSGRRRACICRGRLTRFVLVTGRTNVTVGENVSVVAAADHVRVIEASRSVRDKV